MYALTFIYLMKNTKSDNWEKYIWVHIRSKHLSNLLKQRWKRRYNVTNSKQNKCGIVLHLLILHQHLLKHLAKKWWWRFQLHSKRKRKPGFCYYVRWVCLLYDIGIKDVCKIANIYFKIPLICYQWLGL